MFLAVSAKFFLSTRRYCVTKTLHSNHCNLERFLRLFCCAASASGLFDEPSIDGCVICLVSSLSNSARMASMLNSDVQLSIFALVSSKSNLNSSKIVSLVCLRRILV